MRIRIPTRAGDSISRHLMMAIWIIRVVLERGSHGWSNASWAALLTTHHTHQENFMLKIAGGPFRIRVSDAARVLGSLSPLIQWHTRFLYIGVLTHRHRTIHQAFYHLLLPYLDLPPQIYHVCALTWTFFLRYQLKLNWVRGRIFYVQVFGSSTRKTGWD